MASCSTEQWSGNSTPKVTLTVTEQSSNGGQSVLAWTFQYVTNGYTASTSVNKEYSVVVGGETVASGSCSINGKTTFTIASGTKTITKTHSAQTIAFSCSFGFNLTWSDVYGGTKTASGSISVPAKTTYTISYNANGGSGAPTSQTKWHGEDMTISSTSPTRIGYTFKGWALSQSAANEGTWYYQPSSSCGRNENITLYAVWSVNSYTYNIVYKSSSGTQLGTATATYNYGTTNSISPKSFTGYTNPSAQSIAWDSTSAKTITFTYSPTSYNVTINCNGGSGVSSRTYNIETANFNLGTPTRAGYAFLGWTGSNGSTAQQTVTISKGSTGDKSYTANWSENKLTVNYYSNYATYATFQGSAVSVSASTNVLVHSQDFYYDDGASNGLADIQNPDYIYMTRTGYTSTGNWGTSASGGTLINQSTSYTNSQALAQALGKDLTNGNASINLYAQWNINTYTFNYNANKGTGSMSSHTVDWNSVFTPSANAFKREGYKFIGWNAYRHSDNKWYVSNQGWLTENEIASGGYEKKLYNTQDPLTFNIYWIEGNESVISQYTYYAVWEISGVIYIDNGTTFVPYLTYIDNGTSWDLYLAYVDDGTNWNIIS